MQLQSSARAKWSPSLPSGAKVASNYLPSGANWFFFGLSNHFDLAAAARVPIFHVVIEDWCDLRSVRMGGGRSVVSLNSYKSSLRS